MNEPSLGLGVDSALRFLGEGYREHEVMPQVQMPIFPAGTTKITPELAFEKRAGKVVYFNGHLPVFMPGEEELGAFRLYTCQLIVNGTASQGQSVAAFGVPLVTVMRCVKRLREEVA